MEMCEFHKVFHVKPLCNEFAIHAKGQPTCPLSTRLVPAQKFPKNSHVNASKGIEWPRGLSDLLCAAVDNLAQ